jgi:hypothetical protein
MKNKNTIKNLTVKEIVENVQSELIQAIETIKELQAQVGTPIGEAEAVTETEMLVYDMEQSIERLGNVEYTIIFAIMAGVYAGNIEAKGEGMFDGIGADTIKHCYEYLHLAEQYDIPWNEDNEIATDCVHNDICDLMWMKYADDIPLKEIKTKWGSIYIEELFSKREEEERIKIYDSNKKYMDYFDVEHLQDCANEMGHSLRWEYYTRINNFTEANYIEDLTQLIYTDLLHASYITKNWRDGAEYLKINNISICNLTEFEENEYVNKVGDYYIILSD